MFIDTWSRDTLETSVARCLNRTIPEIYSEIEKADQVSRQPEGGHDADVFQEEVLKFVKTCDLELLNQIQFYHLARRLNIDEDVEGKNLQTLLLTENAFTSFLRKRGVTFRENEHIDVIYNGIVQDISEHKLEVNVNYLYSRLGYYKENLDYYFNGLAFHDQIKKNYYADALRDGPEILSNLSRLLNKPQLILDYEKSSRYYCFAYCVPMSEIVFEDKPKLEDDAKMTYFLQRCFERLHQYWMGEEITGDSDNPILVLRNNKNMSAVYFTQKELVDQEVF